jgi:glycerol-3-phosphate acyltransferase PlsY
MERIVITVVAGYLLGSVPFSLIVGKLVMGIDVRQHGSGNLGAANTLRTLGVTPGVAVLLLDACKGATGALVGSLLWREGLPAGEVELMLLGGLGAVCGHVWTVFASFRGGRGVAAAAGVFFAVAPAAAAMSLAVWVILVAVWRYVSLGSMIAAVILPVAVFGTTWKRVEGWQSLVAVSLAVAVLVVFRHRGNLERILKGTERKLSVPRGEESE